MNRQKPKDEQARLAALERYGVMDTSAEADFDDFTQLASQICQTPIALISLVDELRQWFKSRFGLEVCETPRNLSFCQHVIQKDEVGLVEICDTLDDPRFRDNPLVTGEPHIRFYAGAPLITPDGHVVGTLCVIDHAPRRLTTRQRDGLARLAHQVISQLELRRSRQDLKRELSARRKAETLLAESNESLQQSTERTEQIIASALDAVVTMDLGGLITSWNPQAEIVFGWSAGEVLERKMSEVIIPPAYREAHEQGHRHLIKTGEAKVLDRRLEMSALRRNGDEFPIELTIARVTVAGRPHFSAFIRDLTERSNAEAKLTKARLEKEEAERRRMKELEDSAATLECRVAERTAEVERTRQQFEDFFEHAPNGMVMTDLDGKIRLVNRQAEKIFGWTRAELEGQDLALLMPSAFKADQRFGLGHLRKPDQGWPMAGEDSNFVGIHKDGGEFHLEISLNPVEIEDGTLIAIEVRDISDRKALEQELSSISSHEQQRFAHELHDHMGAYLAGIAFRCKTLAETLERRDQPEAATARELVLQVNAGIDQVRNFARLLNPVGLDLGGLGAGLSRLGQEVGKVFGVQCQVQVPPELPGLGEEQSLQLYRIAQEAIRNAVQHGRAQNITLSLDYEAGHLVQTVASDGLSWDPEVKPAQGSGLRIMRHRAADLGGTFVIQTSPAGGTEAICRMPLGRETDANPRPDS